MSEQITDRREVNRVILLLAVTYMVSYMTRINYGAAIAEMVADTGMAKSTLSMALTGSFVTYGVGQIFSGISGDHFSPKKLVFYGLLFSAAMNALIPFCKDPYQMLAVWCFNGFAQAFLWPPLARLMSALLSEEDYNRASVRVSWGSSVGTILIYLIVPALISISGWRSVFFVSAAFGVIMAIFWNMKCRDVAPVERKNRQAQNKGAAALLSPVMLSIMLAIVLQGMLRDGVTTWMPSYIAETYHLSSEVSILTGVVLPVFSILSFQIALRLYEKKFTNPVMCASVFFGVSALSSMALVLMAGMNAAFSVFFSAVLTSCMHGVNMLLICMVPVFFRKQGIVSTVSGVLNSCTYIGSAISTYGGAVISERMGWNATLVIWMLIAVAGTVVCVASARPWDRFHSES